MTFCRLNFTAEDKGGVLSFLTHLQQWRGMLDAAEITAARRLQGLSVTAPTDLAAATKRDGRSGNTVFTRAATLAAVGSLTEPLQTGDIHGGHVDAMANMQWRPSDRSPQRRHSRTLYKTESVSMSDRSRSQTRPPLGTDAGTTPPTS